MKRGKRLRRGDGCKCDFKQVGNDGWLMDMGRPEIVVTNSAR